MPPHDLAACGYWHARGRPTHTSVSVFLLLFFWSLLPSVREATGKETTQGDGGCGERRDRRTAQPSAGWRPSCTACLAARQRRATSAPGGSEAEGGRGLSSKKAGADAGRSARRRVDAPRADDGRAATGRQRRTRRLVPRKRRASEVAREREGRPQPAKAKEPLSGTSAAKKRERL